MMTIPRATPRYRPSPGRPFPSLGWGILDWGYRHIPSPTHEREPFVLTPQQARMVLQMYRLDEHGERVCRRVHLEEPKGWGKSPLAAFLALTELSGPVCFDGWDETGQPMGVPWGTGGRQAPWVQIAAVSEDQTENTFRALYEMVTADGGRCATELGIDVGRTRLNLRHMPGAYLERVTASAGSREGQRLTFAVADEPQLWTEGNHGLALARTILRNIAKAAGWALFTGNAPVIGRGSVAEVYSHPSPGTLHLGDHPDPVPEQGWTDEQKLATLDRLYEGAYWIDRRRLLEEVNDPVHPWEDSLRFFFNHRTREREDAWVTAEQWRACEGADELDPKLPIGVGVYKHTDSTEAAVVVAQRQDERLVVRHTPYHADGTGHVPTEAIRERLRQLHAEYPAPAMRDPKTRWPVRGPAVAFDRMQFEDSAETLDSQGVNMVDFPLGAAHMGPASASAYEMILTHRLAHEADAMLAEQLKGTVVRITERGGVVIPNRKPGTAPNHAIIALVMAVGMATQDAPPPPRSSPRVRSAGF